MNEYIIILGAGKNQLPFILEAKKLGFKTIVFDIDEKKIGVKKADIFYNISIYESDKIINILDSLNIKITAVIARVTSQQGILTGYKIAKKYNLTFASKTLIKLGTDKEFLANYCNKYNITTPKTYVLSKKEDIAYVHIEENKFYIIKPAMTKIGKKNIIKFSAKSNLNNLFDLSSSVSENGNALIQEYIDGIDVNVLVEFNHNQFKIIASWDEIISLTKDSHIFGVGLSCPSIINNSDAEEEINQCLEKFNKLLKNEGYLAVFSFKINNSKKAYLIEVHIDLTGDLIAEKLLPASNGKFNFFNLVINLLLNNKNENNYNFKDTILLYHNDTIANCDIYKKIDLLKSLVNNVQIKELPYLNYLKDYVGEK